nr:hypothetical protein [Tanacetum cinerariifolium]
MQNQTSNTLHNAIMESDSKDRPPILAPGIDNDIYSTVDACPNACKMWKAIERLKQGESINVQDLETNLYWEFKKFTSQDGESLNSYYSRNRGKAIVNSPTPIYDEEPSMVAQDDETSKDKKINKLMALISLSFKKIYKPTNINLRTSSNTKVSPDAADSGSIFDTELVQKVSNNENYNVFAIKSGHPEQSKSVHDTYLIEQDKHDVIIDSLDMSYEREQIDQNDDDNDLANESQLLASLIETLKCEIDDNKNRNKFLETSNKVLVEKLKGEIEDFKNRNKSLESSNNHFKEANNKLSETNKLLYNDFKKSQAELKRQQKEAQIKLYKTREDKELDKFIALENKVKKNGWMNPFRGIKMCKISKELFKIKRSAGIIFDGVERCKETIAKRTYFGHIDPFIKNKIEAIFCPEIRKINADLENFHLCLNEEMVANLRYFNSLELEVDSLKSQLETQKTQFLNEIDQLSREYYYADHMNAILGVIPTTSVSRPQLKCNQMEDRVTPNNSQGKKQEVEDHRRNVKFSKNNTSVTGNDSLNAKTLNVNFVCPTCGKCVLNQKHDMYVLKSHNIVHSRTKMPIAIPVSTREPKRTVKQSVSKPLRKTVASESTNQKPRNTSRKLYERVSKICSWWYSKFTPPGYKWKPKSEIGNVNLNLVEIIIFIVDSGCSKHMTGNLKLLINFVEKFLGTEKFGNDQIAHILSYGDLVQGAVTIKRVYYIEGLNHNLFSVSQLCDADLEVAFQKSTCYIRDLKRNDLLNGSHGTYLYSITLQDTTSPNPICLMAKATSSQAWLWHRRLSHLNFDTINLLSKNDIMIGLPKLKFVKDHLCSSCELGKAKLKSFQTKITPSSKRRLQLLHMDLCGPIRVSIINGKRYVLVIVDDYSRYTWTHFLRSKDETPEVLIDFLRLVQRGLHSQVRIVRTDKGTDLLNKTLHAYFAAERILHQTSVARTPEQNGADAIATACFTENRSLVIPRHEKTPYHIINDWKPLVNFFHIFGSLCYIVRDGENLDKMKEKDHVSSDPGPKCQRTALEHESLSPGPLCQENVTQADMTITTSNELDLLFSLMFDELLNGSSQVVPKSFVVTTVDATNQRQHQNTTPLNTQTTPEPTCQVPTQAPTVTSIENINQAEISAEHEQVADDEFINIFCTPVQDRKETSSRHVDSSNIHTFCQHHPSEHRWTKDHPLEQVIRNPSQSVRTRHQLESDGEMCMFTLTVSQIEPKNIKEAMADSAWIESIQEELHQFDRLDVWELVDIPLCKNVINMKWLWKNKSDEENSIIRNKRKELILKNHLHQLLDWKLGDILLVQIYVDDIIFGSTNPKLSKQFEKLMHNKFEMSMIWELKFFLGIQIHQSPRGIFINQAKYAQEILTKHGITSCDSVGTQMATKHLDADLSGTPIDQMKYRSMVKALMYLTTSRPDIMHPTCYCAPYQAKPTEKHLTAAAIVISCNPVQHSRTKHIDVRYHFIKEKIEKGIVELFFFGTEYQLADLFTKDLPEERFKYLVRGLGMRCLTPE